MTMARTLQLNRHAGSKSDASNWKSTQRNFENSVGLPASVDVA
jgi:hypothetical protein